MNSKTLTKELREVIESIDRGNKNTATINLHRLLKCGLVANMHLGDYRFELLGDKLDIEYTEDERLLSLEWYGGSLVDVIERSEWAVMNSLINCKDRFAPEIWL